MHNVPIYIAAYRTAFLELAGQKADGYLARPAEFCNELQADVPQDQGCVRCRRQTQNAVQTAGYLLTFIDKTRREALNRAKREPFVIYMMSVLSDFSLEQVGFERELRDQIMAAWRVEATIRPQA